MFKFLLLGLISTTVFSASLRDAEGIYRQRMSRQAKNRKLVLSLASSGHYFSAIPWMKEYLVSNRSTLDSSLERALEKIVSVAGVKQFEVLPTRYLKYSNSGTIKYILGKKYFKRKKFNEALGYLAKIRSSHSIFPFAENLKATIYSIQGSSERASLHFKDCIAFSNNYISSSKITFAKKQYEINKDYCVLGVARSQYAARVFKDAELSYLDIPKSSPIWPEILIEEAWTSYYQKNYNRTLGKLVTYQAPVLYDYFYPEASVLTATSYLKMCLFEDAKAVAERFKQNYFKEARSLRSYLLRKNKDYNYFYRILNDAVRSGAKYGSLKDRILMSVARTSSAQEIFRALKLARLELKKLTSVRQTKLTSRLRRNVEEVIKTDKKILGGLARQGLREKYQEIYESFQYMSYIKLEVLKQRKARLYEPEKYKGKRGDVRYLERNEKQYFWSFNGEFWADELGDYVFALKSEC